MIYAVVALLVVLSIGATLWINRRQKEKEAQELASLSESVRRGDGAQHIREINELLLGGGEASRKLKVLDLFDEFLRQQNVRVEGVTSRYRLALESGGMVGGSDGAALRAFLKRAQSDLGGAVSEASSRCCACTNKALRNKEFREACKAAGFDVDLRTGEVKVQRAGLFVGDLSELVVQRESQKSSLQELENRRAVFCRDCDRLFCEGCIVERDASDSHGGAARCPACSGVLAHAW